MFPEISVLRDQVSGLDKELQRSNMVCVFEYIVKYSLVDCGFGTLWVDIQ